MPEQQPSDQSAERITPAKGLLPPELVVSEPLDEESDGGAGLPEDEWRRLLNAIRMGRCTPFLGAGASSDHIRESSRIAQDWAQAEQFPFPNRNDLIRVSQYLSVRFSHLDPKDRMLSECNVPRPNFQPGDIYDLIASLDIPVFMTTNYDSLMSYALESRGKHPKREICRWQASWCDMVESPLASGFRPDVKNPLVFHFHGHIDCVDSLVLSEDDYLDFLKAVSKNPELVPPQLQKALKTGYVLFLGYSLSDWNIQVLLRSITEYLSGGQQQTHLSVQLSPPLGERASKDDLKRAKEYLSKYFGQQKVSVYWGSCKKFAGELKLRLARSNAQSGVPR